MEIKNQPKMGPARLVTRTANGAALRALACLAYGALLMLTGCHSMQATPEAWAEVNLPSARAFPPPTAATTSQKHAMLTLRQALAELVPALYRLDIAEDLDLNTSIHVDTSKHWLEALGQGLSEANIELITNLTSKSATLRWNKIALAQVIKTYLPSDFTVYSAAGIDLHAPVRFDTRQYWAQALSLGALDNDIELTIHFASKIISLRPRESSPTF